MVSAFRGPRRRPCLKRFPARSRLRDVLMTRGYATGTVLSPHVRHVHLPVQAASTWRPSLSARNDATHPSGDLQRPLTRLNLSSFCHNAKILTETGLWSTARCRGRRRHRQANSVRVCSPTSRRVASLRPRSAGLTALTPAPRTLVQTGSCRRCSRIHPLHVVVDVPSRMTLFRATADTSRWSTRPPRTACS